MSTARVSATAAVLCCLLLIGCGGAGGQPYVPAVADAEGEATREAVPAAGTPEPRALRVLHAWDRRRASAYARGDADALRRLYAPESRAGERDVRLLRGYAEDDLLVTGLRVQVLAVRVVVHRGRVLRLVVRDRVASGAVRRRGAGAAVSLPGGRPARREVTLVRDGRDWVVRAVSAVRPRPGR